MRDATQDLQSHFIQKLNVQEENLQLQVVLEAFSIAHLVFVVVVVVLLRKDINYRP